MGTITGQAIVDKLEITLQDVANVRWTLAELLVYLNDGQREVVTFKPEASVVNDKVLLTAGKTKQSLPTGGIALIDVVRNMGTDGATAGSAIRIINRETLDAQIPTWHSDTNASGLIEHYCFDPRDPKNYYVYPKAPATAWHVELIYSVSPADVASLANTITLDDIYSNALQDYILYRAFSKDATYGDSTRATGYYNNFLRSLGVKTTNETSRNPNLLVGGANPNVPVMK